RWRYQTGDTYHHRFWGQVIRWAASDHTRFDTDKAIYQGGEEVKVTLKLEETEVRELPPDANLKARVLRLTEAGTEEVVAEAALHPRPRQKEVLDGRILKQLPGGSYAVELASSNPDLTAKLAGTGKPDAQGQLRSTFTVTAADNEELTRLEVN